MTAIQQLKNEARRAEQRSDWSRAIALYREVLRLEGAGTGAAADPGLHNRIGDLYLRMGDTESAVRAYEEAATRYAESDLPTSAIALCNKVLRIAPGRDGVLRRLAMLHAGSGLLAEGRSALLQYLDRKESRGDLAEALEAVQEFVDRTADDQIRVRFADILADRAHADEAVAQLRLELADRERRGHDTEPVREHLRALGAEDGGIAAPPAPTGPLDATEEPGALDDVPAPRPGADSGSAPEARTDPRPGGSPESTVVAESPSTVPEPGLVDLPPGPAVPEPAPTGTQPASVARPPDPGSAGPADGDGAGFGRLLAEALRTGPADGRVRPGDIAVADGEPADEPTREIPGELEALADEFRSTVADALEAGGARARYDLGALLQDLGLPDAAASELGRAAAAPGLRRRAATRLRALTDARDETSRVGEPEPPAEAAEPKEARAPAAHRPSGSEAAAGTMSSPVHDVGGDAGGEHGDDGAIDGAYFKARLAQFRVRQATERETIDHQAHLDLAIACLEIGLDEEAVRELGVAARGPRPVADRARELLDRLRPESPKDDDSGAGRPSPSGEAVTQLWADLPSDAVPDEPGVAGPGTEARNLSGETIDDGYPALDPGPSDGRERAESLIEAGRTEEAERALLDAVEQFEALRRPLEALEALGRLIELRPDDVVLHHQRVELALMLNDRDVLVRAYLDLAELLRRQGATRQSRTVYGRILDLDPDDPSARRGLERLQRDELRSEEAKRTARAAADPPVPGGASPAGEFDVLLGDLREEEEADAFPGDPEAHFELGVAFRRMGMWEEALEELRLAARSLADPFAALDGVGECLLRLDRPDEAVGLLSGPAAAPGVDDARRLGALHRLAVALEKTGNPEAAAECLGRIVAVDPEFRDAAGRLSTLST